MGVQGSYMKRLLGVLFILIVMKNLSARRRYRRPVIKYPKDTVFWATDFFVKGCRNFIINCPAAYKNQHICARSHNHDYKDFNNYCEMQYENCNTWKNFNFVSIDSLDTGIPEKICAIALKSNYSNVAIPRNVMLTVIYIILASF